MSERESEEIFEHVTFRSTIPIAMKAFFCLLLLLVLGASANALETTTPKISKPATYWVTFPTRIRARMAIPINVRLLKPYSSSTVIASLRDSNNNNSILVSTDLRVLTGGDVIQNLEIQVPSVIKFPGEKDYYSEWPRLNLYVEATGDVTFNHSVDLTIERKSFSVFVQTDKAIYKPGQTVKLRALAMNSDLTVLKEPMNVLIRDPNGNNIRQWRKVDGVNNTGVVELTMPTSDQPPLGDWTIEVTVFDYTEKKTFTIDKYVLPKFEVMVNLPSYMLTDEPELVGTATAKYTFGKPLTGAQVLVTIKLPYYYHNYGSQPVLTRNGTLDADGKFGFSFNNSELFELVWDSYYNYSGARREYVSLDYQQFVIIANVTDTRTGQKMGGVSSLTVYKNPAVLQFLPMSASNYKPGLTYTAYLSVTKPDGTLLATTTPMAVQFNVTYFVPRATTTTSTTTTTTAAPTTRNGSDITLNLYQKRFPYYYEPDVEIVLTVENKTLPANGFIALEVLVPPEAISIAIEATFMGAHAYQSASKAQSPSKNFLQIQMQTEKPQVGQSVTLIATATEPIRTITYHVIAKGNILSSAEVSANDVTGSQNITISFLVTSNMAPNCRIVAFCFRSDGEVVADSLSFKVDSVSENNVSLSFSKERVKPGEEVDLSITGKENSIVFMLSVDKSVTLLKSGNDITQEMVTRELVWYDYGFGYNNFWRYMSICGWPYPSQGGDTESIFQRAGISMLTDGVIPGGRFRQWHQGRVGASSLAFMSTNNVQDDSGPPQERGAVERVRTFFPETWLWDIVFLGAEGHSVRRLTVPDTITTWLTSAFAIQPQFGLTVLPEAIQLITFRDVFVTLDLPYSTTRGEDLCIKAHAYNYYNQSIDASLTIGESQGLSIIRYTNNIEQRGPLKVTRPIGSVATNQIGETTFCFQTTKLGNVPVRVNLTTTSVPGDGVEQMLLVEPEGLPRSQTDSVVLDVTPGTPFVHTASLRFPDNVVQGSQRITVSVAGNLLGQMEENSDDLLRMPYGCGEQNMLHFAPNVFLIDYMQRTNTYTPARAAKAQNYMLSGYQKQLQYQHDDGSYSAFGPRNTNESGSMWLTAFVTKCFVQAMKLPGDVVTIDPKVVTSSVKWMVSKQLPTGEFPEPGKVFNTNMQGGSGKGEALTAFVLIALYEVNSTLEDLTQLNKSELQASILLSRQYLENQLGSLTDPYDLAIVTYVLHLVQSSAKETAFGLLSAKAIREPLTLHWERPKPDSEQRYYYWERQTDAINIEMTSYALLTYTFRSDLSGALSIVHWMTKQKGPRGGFISTQDTVIGLQSLAGLAAAIYSPNESPITVLVAWDYETKTIIVDDSTKHLLQQVEISFQETAIPSSITITATTNGTSRGIAVAEVLLDYNVAEITNFTTYSLQHNVIMANLDSFTLIIEASRVDGIEGGMTVIEVGIPTGYSLDTSNPDYDVTEARLVETEKGKCVIYLDSLGAKAVRFVLTFDVSNVIPVQLKPSFIYMYDYYDNGGNKQLTSSYELPLLKSNRICDLLPSYSDC